MTKPVKKGRKRRNIRPATAMKAARFAEGVLAGKSQRRAALDAGYTLSMANKATTKIAPYVPGELQRAIQREIGAAGVLATLRESMQATRVQVGFHEGAPVYSEPLVDHAERRKAAELAARLGGMEPERERSESEVQVNVTLLGS